ncbi:hypothetical protein NHQ30_005103 [Ciborinia camelliae]|nr:hypothetical protein NHQ30_005103 [Ciborinia camelliae]
MGKSALTPQTPRKKRVRPISNPLHSDDETFFCSTIRHHYQRPGEQFPAFSRLCSVSFEHEAKFYLECRTFYTFTLDFMTAEESKKSIEGASPPCKVVERSKSYKRPGLPPIVESSESIDEKLELAGPIIPIKMTAEYGIDQGKYGSSPPMASSLPSASSNNGPSSIGFPFSPGPPARPAPAARPSPFSQMVRDVKYPPPILIDSLSNEPIDIIHDNDSETSIVNTNGIASTDHDGIDIITIHSISTNPSTKELDRILSGSRFPNLIYDTESDRYITKANTEMEGGSRLSFELHVDGVKGDGGKLVGRMVVRPEATIMKYTNSDEVTGFRPLRLKPQVQADGVYREDNDEGGNGDDAVVKRHVRIASDPERPGTSRADQPVGRLRSDTEPVKRISRSPYASTSQNLQDLPTPSSRRRKINPIYLPARNDNAETSPRRPFTPVNTRSPTPRIRPIRSPPPTDRPYRHISQLMAGTPHVCTSASQDHGSTGDEDDYSPILVDVTSLVPPQRAIKSPAAYMSSSLPPSPPLTESLGRTQNYTYDLPLIFSSPSPIALPPKLASATPAAPATTSNSKISFSDQQILSTNSSIYSISTPESSPHNSAVIPPTLERIPSIPSPPNTPKIDLFRSNTIHTISTIPSTFTQTDTYTHTRQSTNSTMASSISSSILNPSPSAIPSPSASPNPSPNPPTNTLSHESIALTEHLVREGIYGGIVYDISATHPNSPPRLTPKPTPAQIRRQQKRSAKDSKAILRARMKKEMRERKQIANAQEQVRISSAAARLRIFKAKLRKAQLAVKGKRGKVSYLGIRVFLRGLGSGVRVRWQGVRRRLASVRLSVVGDRGLSVGGEL